METLPYIILSVLLVGTLLILLDLPYLSGSVLASGAGERIFVRIMAPVLLLAGIVVPVMYPEYFSQMSEGLWRVEACDNFLPVGIATAVASVIVLGLSRYSAVPFAFVASLAGLAASHGEILEAGEILPYLLSWVAAPLMCAVLSAGIYCIFASVQRNRNVHLAVTESRYLSAATLISLLLIPSASLNNSVVFGYLPLGLGSVAPWVTAACVLVSVPVVLKQVTMKMWNVADYELDANPQSVLSLLSGMLICFLLFTGRIPSKIGLVATPLPAGVLFLAGLTGISICSRRSLVDGRDWLKGLVATYLSPALAFLLAFSLGKVMDGVLMGTFVVLGVILIVAGIVLYMRLQDKRIVSQQIARAHEQQVYSTRKSLSALEVRAEMTEKDLLDKLEAKRKELVDFAMGISDQKNFMENVYEQLKMVRGAKEGEEKDARCDALLRSLRERMYFTREVNDFYARSEELHKDFNQRLGEAFPHLTENERKLANLLRQGFSSKYIASLMNITPKSVEINRYRLRAKLGLKRGDNLIKFIKSV